MTICMFVTNLSLRGQYPVIDPRRAAGAGPFNFGYALAQDGITITVARSSSLQPCEMQVDLVSMLQEPKDILAWNLFGDSFVDRIGSPGLGLPSTMKITKASTVEQGCGTGADTIVLRRKRPWPDGWVANYWFSRDGLRPVARRGMGSLRAVAARVSRP
jgi:hypothetical protein